MAGEGVPSSYPGQQQSPPQILPTPMPPNEDLSRAAALSFARDPDTRFHQTATHSSHTFPSTANPEPGHRPESSACGTQRPYRESAAGSSSVPGTAKNRMPSVAAMEPHL